MKKHFILFGLLIAGLVDTKAQKLTDSLIVFYNFQGDTKDNSGNNLDATLNGPTLTTDRFGNLNSAYSFDGVNDIITFPTSNKMKPTLPITVSFWIKSDKSAVTNPVFGNNYQNNKYNGITMNIGSDGNVAISFGDGNGAGSGNRQGKTSNLKVTQGKWHHVVGVWRGVKDMDIYIDSVNAGGTYSGSATTIKYTSDPGQIGNFESLGGPLNYFQGSMDKFAMWHRALTSSEVKQLFVSYLAVNPIDKPSNIKILPNPACDILSVSTNYTSYGLKYELIDIAGKVIKDGSIDSDITTIDIQNLFSGIYILRIANNSYKVIKN